MVKKKANIQEIIDENRPIAFEEAVGKADLRSKLAEIRKCDGIIGYMLRDPNSALVDLNEPTRIPEYAIFSSATGEAAIKLSKALSLGDIKHVIVEGKHARMLLVNVGKTRISVFTQKNTDVNNILNKLKES
jgi:predicted regulator of Ras-like GTPase activity (Roadblock/LC7/MglB family)